MAIERHSLKLFEGALHFCEIAEEELLYSLQCHDIDALLGEELGRLRLRRQAIDLLEVEVLGDILAQADKADRQILVLARPREPAACRSRVFLYLFQIHAAVCF